MKPNLRLLVTGFFMSAAGPLPARLWTSVDGHSVEALLVSADDTTATLRLANQRQVVMSLESLSAVDTVYVREWLKKNPGSRTKSAPVPAKPPAGPLTAPSAGPDPGRPRESGDGPAGFDGPWPAQAVVPAELNIAVAREDDAAHVYIYRSTHFEFTSNVQLRPRLVSACARVFEATHEFLRLLPLNHRTTAPGQPLFPVLLFEHFEEYVKAGGPPGSAGVCMTRGNISKVLVPLRSLGVKKTGRDYTIDPGDRDYHVLSHEITHQIMESAVKDASWYIEGSAEYVANTEYTGGRYKIGVNKKSIIESVTAYGKDGNGGRALGTDLTMPPLKTFMALSYGEFLRDSRQNYGLACLLTYYWYHQDGAGDAARMKRYLKDLQSGIPDIRAREKLLDGRSWEEVEESFAKSLRKAGVKIRFQ